MAHIFFTSGNYIRVTEKAAQDVKRALDRQIDARWAFQNVTEKTVDGTRYRNTLINLRNVERIEWFS